jgi:hypothetical protein
MPPSTRESTNPRSPDGRGRLLFRRRVATARTGGSGDQVGVERGPAAPPRGRARPPDTCPRSAHGSGPPSASRSQPSHTVRHEGWPPSRRGPDPSERSVGIAAKARPERTSAGSTKRWGPLGPDVCCLLRYRNTDTTASLPCVCVRMGRARRTTAATRGTTRVHPAVTTGTAKGPCGPAHSSCPVVEVTERIRAGWTRRSRSTRM